LKVKRHKAAESRATGGRDTPPARTNGERIMVSLILGTLFFVGIHIFISGTQLRDRLVARLGENGYRILFSLASLGGIVWMCAAYNGAPYVPLWGRIEGLIPITIVLVFVGFLIGVPGLLIRSPTAVGGETDAGLLKAEGILRVTRHPFLWGVTLWAFGHLIANGDVASLIFFLGFLVLAVAGQFSIDAKRQRRLGSRWQTFAAVTSRAPYGAVVAGRNTFSLVEIGWWRIAIAVLLFALLFWLHPMLFGVRPYPVW
jgi:uncharacterized membrane protein